MLAQLAAVHQVINEDMIFLTQPANSVVAAGQQYAY